MFQDISILDKENNNDTAKCSIGEKITISHIYDDKGNIIENNVVFEMTKMDG